MKAFGYTIEADARARARLTSIRIHRNYQIDRRYRHLVWWRFSLQYAPTQYCEECEVETGLDPICQDCFEHHYCECGQRLEDSWGTPGDGFCARCR